MKTWVNLPNRQPDLPRNMERTLPRTELAQISSPEVLGPAATAISWIAMRMEKAKSLVVAIPSQKSPQKIFQVKAYRCGHFKFISL